MAKLKLKSWEVEGKLWTIICCERLNWNPKGVVISIFYDNWQVDDMTADLIISQLLFLDAEDQEKDIKLFINSPGGSVTAGMSLTIIL